MLGVGVAALLLLIGLAGCPAGGPDLTPDATLVGRWKLDSGGVVATY
jgi:hypothetical protein